EIGEVYQALTALGNLQITDPTLRYRVARNLARLKKASKLGGECETAIKTKYGKLMDNKYIYEDGKQELAQKEIEALLNKPIEEELFLLDQSKLNELKDLKATTEAVLVPIIEEDVIGLGKETIETLKG
ncbi:MAG: hypothetical protein QME51_11175, partial [Planctomycetota bacterium]|nr:hypothetical protein [Planctomycetota bacterium]